MTILAPLLKYSRDGLDAYKASLKWNENLQLTNYLLTITRPFMRVPV